MTIKNYNQLKQKLTELNQKYIQENQEKIQPSSDASHPVVGRVVGRRIETQGFLVV